MRTWRQLCGIGAVSVAAFSLAANGCWIDRSGLLPAGSSAGASVPTGGAGGEGQGGSSGIPCGSVADCPGVDSDCGYRSCEAGRCGFENLPRDTPCAEEPGNLCDGDGRCLKVVGLPCFQHDQCLSGFCIDLVCCDTQCNSFCESCDQEDWLGQCRLNEPLTDPDDECEPRGSCDGSAGCAFGNDAWSRGYGDVNDDRIYGVAVDTSGSVVVVGQFEGDIDFGQGTLTSRGSTDVFVAKLSDAGVLQWAHSYGATMASDAEGAFGVAIDSGGGIIVVGHFNGIIDFSSTTPTAEQLSSDGMSDAFVLKLNSAGDYLWSKRFGGSRPDIAGAVALDSNDGIIIAGSFESGSIDLDGQVLTNAHTGNTNDLFIAKLNASGVVQWASRYGDTTNQCLPDVPCVDLAVDSADNVVFAGGVAGDVDFGGGLKVGGADADAVVARFSAAGAWQWDGRFGDASPQHVADVTISPSNQVVITGAYEGLVDFDSGVLPTATYPTAFLARFDGSGFGMAARELGGSFGSAGRAVVVDPRENVVLLGQFGGPSGGTVTLAPALTLTSVGRQDLFLVKYGVADTVLWRHQFGDGYDEIASQMVLDDSDNSIFVGHYQGQITFGSNILPSQHTSYFDVFVAKYRP